MNFTLPVVLSYFLMLCVFHYIAPQGVGTENDTFGTKGNKKQVENYTFLIKNTNLSFLTQSKKDSFKR